MREVRYEKVESYQRSDVQLTAQIIFLLPDPTATFCISWHTPATLDQDTEAKKRREYSRNESQGFVRGAWKLANRCAMREIRESRRALRRIAGGGASALSGFGCVKRTGWCVGWCVGWMLVGGGEKDAGEGRCIARERTSARHRADTCACHGRDSPPSHNPTTISPAGRPQESSTERHRSSLPTSKRSAAIRSSRLVHRMLSGSPALLHFAESGYSPPASAGEEKCARGLNDGDTFRRVRVCDVEIPPSSSCGGLARWRWPPSTQGPDRTSARTAQERARRGQRGAEAEKGPWGGTQADGPRRTLGRTMIQIAGRFFLAIPIRGLAPEHPGKEQAKEQAKEEGNTLLGRSTPTPRCTTCCERKASPVVHGARSGRPQPIGYASSSLSRHREVLPRRAAQSWVPRAAVSRDGDVVPSALLCSMQRLGVADPPELWRTPWTPTFLCLSRNLDRPWDSTCLGSRRRAYREVLGSLPLDEDQYYYNSTTLLLYNSTTLLLYNSTTLKLYNSTLLLLPPPPPPPPPPQQAKTPPVRDQPHARKRAHIHRIPTTKRLRPS
ncbi:unnamed protein product [Diplocarpon coronariae]